MATIIQIRGDTAAQWTSENPTLAVREMAVETDTRKIKIGDGATAWNSLDYAVTEGGVGGDYTAPEVKVIASSPYTVIQSDNGKILFISTSGALTLNLPDDLDEDTQVSLLGNVDGAITLTAQGDSDLFPADFEANSGEGVPVALSFLFRSDVWYVYGASRVNTITVVYDAGWPADRPDAVHVWAVGHTSAPSWLESDTDIWLEDVS